MGPFDITSSHIHGLNDDQLREVLRLLLEAEVKKYGIPLSAIVLGGNQNAADGGVDARVEWDNQVDRTEWLPKRLVVVQSKAEAMPRSKLLDELAPNATPRRLFEELASRTGAYIVFSTDDCTDSMYRERLSAMRDTVSGIPLSDRIAFDFYDASRIARWVNSFQSVANQVRNLVGQPMAGWRPFENWSAPNLSISLEYLIDERPKVNFAGVGEQAFSISEAIVRVRDRLRTPGLATRLVGVSGVGKTRFAQALFDERVAQGALNSGLVVYGDLGQSPTTTPSQVAEQLLYAHQTTVLIVDNCPSDTHRALVGIIQRPNSAISLLTIDFDVGHDQPENTQVIRLYENGDQLIEALLIERARALSSLDRHRVVTFAAGNARVALAIAANHDGSASLANLSDRQLIDRLFLDGRRPFDDSLRRCAEIASLVYAFHVDREGKQKPEHPVLAELAEVSSLHMYGAIAELVDRGTAQKRGTQRAILPQALAIRLATQALDRLPLDTVLTKFKQGSQKRLLRSFTRRLGNLHGSEPARQIAADILGDYSDLTTVNAGDLQIVENLAPAVPELVLLGIERAIDASLDGWFASLQNTQRWRFAKLARNIAYDAAYFERAARVLLAFAKEEPEDHKDNAVRPHFLELFWIRLSWTQAPPEIRYRLIDSMLSEGDDAERFLAVVALDHALSTGPFSSSHNGDFGSRPMGKEWRPLSDVEQDHWFNQALCRLSDIACQETELGKKARTSISHEIRGLIRIGLVESIALAVRAIHARGYWREGWKYLCEALHFDRKNWMAEAQWKVKELERELRPISIEDRFSTYVVNEPWGLYPANENGSGEERDMFSCARDLGQEVASVSNIWPSLVRQCCAFTGYSNCHAFGRGLAMGASDVSEVWHQLISIFGEIESTERNAQVLSGFIYAVASRGGEEVQAWLDHAVADEELGPYIVELSIHVPIDRRSINRLTHSVRLGMTSLWTYRRLSGGRVVASTPPDALASFLRELALKGNEGAMITADILHMYLFGREEGETVAPDLAILGRQLLCSTQLYQNSSRIEIHHLEQIAKKCLVGFENEQAVREICGLLVSVAGSRTSIARQVGGLIKALADIHPMTVLDSVLATDDTAEIFGEELFGHTDDEPSSNQPATMNESEDLLLNWIAGEPITRAARVARFVQYLCEPVQGTASWTPIANRLVNLPDVGVKVLDEFYSRFGVGAGWGSWHDRFIRRRPLLLVLTSHSNSAIQLWARNAVEKLDALVKKIIEQEHIRDERFE